MDMDSKDRFDSVSQRELDKLEQHIKGSIIILGEGIKQLIIANDSRYEQRFLDSQTAVQAALSAAKEAVIKAEGASEKRFESVNEFRSTLSDQQRLFMPRIEAEVRMNNLESKTDANERNINNISSTRTAGKEIWAYVVAGISIIIAISSFLFKG